MLATAQWWWPCRTAVADPVAPRRGGPPSERVLAATVVRHVAASRTRCGTPGPPSWRGRRGRAATRGLEVLGSSWTSDARLTAPAVDPTDLNRVLLAAAVVLLAAVAAVRVSTRAGLPSLLVYLAIGLVDRGGRARPASSRTPTSPRCSARVALAVILAEGGFTTDWRTIRPVAPLAGVLATVGVALGRGHHGARPPGPRRRPAHRDPARRGRVVHRRGGGLRGAAVDADPGRLRATVEAESGFNDPPVIILVTVVTSERVGPTPRGSGSSGRSPTSSCSAWGSVSWSPGPACGCSRAARCRRPGCTRSRRWRSPSSRSRSPGVAGGSALMAIYVAGLSLGNARLPAPGHHRRFVEGLAWLAQIGLFIMLGLLASPARLLDALPYALLVGGALTLVARPLSVALCATPFRVPWRDQAFISWAGPARRRTDRAGHRPDERRAARGAPHLRRRLPAGRALHARAGPDPALGRAPARCHRGGEPARRSTSSPRRSTRSKRRCCSSPSPPGPGWPAWRSPSCGCRSARPSRWCCARARSSLPARPPCCAPVTTCWSPRARGRPARRSSAGSGRSASPVGWPGGTPTSPGGTRR